MPLAIRKIDRKPLWEKTTDKAVASWLQEGELQADVLADIKTQENKLSIFLVNPEAGITVERIVVALAAQRNHLAQLSYIEFDTSILEELKIDVDKIKGATPDNSVNEQHLDLIQLSSTKLVQLALAIKARGSANRMLDQAVGKSVNVALAKGRLDKSAISDTLISKLSDKKYQAD